jgi:hypothetical protein
MDPLFIVIVLALVATGLALLLGLMSMVSGGETDQALSTPLMWTRVGLQAFTVLLLLLATLLYGGST